MKPVELSNPRNPWTSQSIEYLEEVPQVTLQVFEDKTKTILNENDSPDLGFRWSVNPYRGCMHACAYCYARPTHEYLGFGAGTDFDRKIMVKLDAPRLLKKAFSKKSWQRETVAFSGVTDCYQPLEASYSLTRQCLVVCLEANTPVGIVTKGALIERDIDILTDISKKLGLMISISIPIWDEELSRKIEPLVPSPLRRIKTIERLSKAGLNVCVLVAPVIPGLTDEQIPAILNAAKNAGASHAGHSILRLPGNAAEVFVNRVQESIPLRAERIISRTRQVRGGALDDKRFGRRFSAEGPHADMIHQLFKISAWRAGFTNYHRSENENHMQEQRVELPLVELSPSAKTAQMPQEDTENGQLSLFGKKY